MEWDVWVGGVGYDLLSSAERTFQFTKNEINSHSLMGSLVTLTDSTCATFITPPPILLTNESNRIFAH